MDPRRQGDPESLSLDHELRPDVPALGSDLTHGSGNPHQFSSVQSFSRVRLFVTLWTAACQAPLSFTISQSLLKFLKCLLFIYTALDPRASSGIEMIEESAWAIFNLNSQKQSQLKQTKKGGGSNNLRKKRIIT